jgi:hypothetical protein
VKPALSPSTGYNLGLVSGLLISKVLAVLLVLVALRLRQPRIVVPANFWSAGLVTWDVFSGGWRAIQALSGASG